MYSPTTYLQLQILGEIEIAHIYNLYKTGTLKGRVSRFGACASDNESAVKPIVFGPIRSEYTTPAGYGGQVL